MRKVQGWVGQGIQGEGLQVELEERRTRVGEGERERGAGLHSPLLLGNGGARLATRDMIRARPGPFRTLPWRHGRDQNQRAPRDRAGLSSLGVDSSAALWSLARLDPARVNSMAHAPPRELLVDSRRPLRRARCAASISSPRSTPPRTQRPFSAKWASSPRRLCGIISRSMQACGSGIRQSSARHPGS